MVFGFFFKTANKVIDYETFIVLFHYKYNDIQIQKSRMEKKVSGFLHT